MLYYVSYVRLKTIILLLALYVVAAGTSYSVSDTVTGFILAGIALFSFAMAAILISAHQSISRAHDGNVFFGDYFKGVSVRSFNLFLRKKGDDGKDEYGIFFQIDGEAEQTFYRLVVDTVEKTAVLTRPELTILSSGTSYSNARKYADGLQKIFKFNEISVEYVVKEEDTHVIQKPV